MSFTNECPRLALLLTCWSSLSLAFAAPPYFAIRVVDEQTGRGVPLVELRTNNGVRYYTDNNGLVAFFEPGLMDRQVYFAVSSHGYEYPAGALGARGAKLQTATGGSATLKIKRLNIAQRLYRVTGQGLYRDSVLLGKPTPLEHPLLNAEVMGSDSVVNAVLRGKLYWFWGDTHRVGHALGNFHVPGATSLLPKDGGLDPEVGVDLHYFVRPDGFAKETCRMPGKQPTWIDGLTVLRDATGRQRMFAAFVKPDKGLKPLRRGLVEWNEAKEVFEQIAELPVDSPLRPQGHPLAHTEGGQAYVYFANPYAWCRVPATVAAFTDLSRYEGYTCLTADGEVDRDAEGNVRYRWRQGVAPWNPTTQKELLKAGKLKPDDCLIQLREVGTGAEVKAHRGSICWNEFRQRFVLIATSQFGGSSFLGEVWYSEAERPEGPWQRAHKIVTHNKMSFYNPKQHPYFDKDGGRTIFFEGTYVNTFSGNPDQTPRYNYNQVLYKLDLTDERLSLR